MATNYLTRTPYHAGNRKNLLINVGLKINDKIANNGYLVAKTTGK